MREIKLRAWCSDSGDNIMVYYDKMELMDNGIWFPNDGKHTSEIIELMQFTGLKDHKGNNIYEGDILVDRKSTWLVSWNDNHACFQVTNQEHPSVVAEVIDNQNMTIVGNIYENPI